MATFPYPPMPQGAEKSVIKPSRWFIEHVYRCILAILLFVITYIFLLFATIAIAIAFCYLGYYILSAHIGFLSLVGGLGICICGLMLVFFVIKFLFKRNQTDYSGMVAISRDEQPDLFAFIDQLTSETKAAKPKKIFLTANVNAGVFYSSSFWSMFFPVRKNLQIGLGLVNSINVSEFKAVMAHEFGHFSQRSMKFGSYVYNLNKVIYNMLFENDSYHKVLNSWARMHSVFKLMALLNINLIKAIQFILKKVYVVVNSAYLALSREMEFHADAIAGYVGGSNHAISSLQRIEVGQVCYDNLLSYWNSKLSQNERSANLYPEHLEAIKIFSADRDVRIDQSGLPVIAKGVSIIGEGMITVDDKWSSHPSSADRELKLGQINLNTVAINERAWCLFNNPTKLQEQLTDLIYSGSNIKDDAKVVIFEDFKNSFYAAVHTHLYNEKYKHYYDNRNITLFKIDEAINTSPAAKTLTFEALFTDENCTLPKELEKKRQNIEVLTMLISDGGRSGTFSYLGTKYNNDDASGVQGHINKEYAAAVKWMEELDKTIFQYFYLVNKAAGTEQQLVDKYAALFQYQTESEKDFAIYNEIMLAIKPIYTVMKPGKIRETLDNVYFMEGPLKIRLRQIITDMEFARYFTEEQLKDLNVYLKMNWVYYLDPTYDNHAISIFNKAMNAFVAVVSKRLFELKKNLLDFQISSIEG